MGKPIKKKQIGGVRLAIWENEGKYGKKLSFTFDKNYKSGDEWKTSKSFSQSDLGDLIALAQWVQQQKISKDKKEVGQHLVEEFAGQHVDEHKDIPF